MFHVQLDLTTIPVIDTFLGRQDELQQLWQYLRPESSQSRKIAIIHGLGGMGKTQLAIRFARDHKNEGDFTTIFWLNGKDRGTLVHSLSSLLPKLPGQSSIAQAADENEAEQQAKQVLQWLSINGNSRWLIVFDNIDQHSSSGTNENENYDIREFFPSADHGSILITSRLQRLVELGRSFPIKRLGSTDSISLLCQSSGLSDNHNIQELKNNSGKYFCV
jgi:NB-ARC domain